MSHFSVSSLFSSFAFPLGSSRERQAGGSTFHGAVEEVRIVRHVRWETKPTDTDISARMTFLPVRDCFTRNMKCLTRIQWQRLLVYRRSVAKEFRADALLFHTSANFAHEFIRRRATAKRRIITIRGSNVSGDWGRLEGKERIITTALPRWLRTRVTTLAAR